ncbi:MAG: hypothetical protein RB191_11350 [Terriglobia bacterium]|nr:hypothetical protein [Terriglobia bacterium]
MLTDGLAISIPANSTVNVFAGRPIEFIGTPSVARLLDIADAPGLQHQWLINVGGVQSVPIAAGSSVNVAAAAGQGPKDDEDTVATNVPIPAGARNQLNITNTTGAAVIFRYRAYILP